MVEVTAFELGGGAGARAGVNEHREDGAVAQAHDVRGIHGREELSRVRLGNLRRLAFDHAIALAADGEGRVEHDGMTGHQAVEEMPQGGEVLIARGDAGGFRKLRKILPHVPGARSGSTRPDVFLRPLQEKLHRVPVSALRARIAQRAVEELFGREHGGVTGAVDDVRQVVGNCRGKNS
jgi:hypothetical protein